MVKQKEIIRVKVDKPKEFMTFSTKVKVESIKEHCREIGLLKPGKLSRIEKSNILPFPKRLVNTDTLTKQEWLTWRQKGVGGSDIASICGINPWHSALACYYDKTEKVPELEAENLPAELGIFKEPFVKMKFEKWLKENEGIELTVCRTPYILQHPTNEIALANLDGHFFHPLKKEDAIVEYKCTSERNYANWIDENLPDYHYLQIQWYLYVTSCKICYLAYLIGDSKFNVIVIKRNDEVIEQIIGKVDYFWKNFVEKKVAPAPDGTDSSKKVLDLMYKDVKVGKEIVIEDVKYQTYIKEINSIKSKAKDLKKDLEQYQQWIKEKMGTAETGICGEWKITWKEQSKKEYLVHASTSRVLRISKNKGE